MVIFFKEVDGADRGLNASVKLLLEIQTTENYSLFVVTFHQCDESKEFFTFGTNFILSYYIPSHFMPETHITKSKRLWLVKTVDLDCHFRLLTVQILILETLAGIKSCRGHVSYSFFNFFILNNEFILIIFFHEINNKKFKNGRQYGS